MFKTDDKVTAIDHHKSSLLLQQQKTAKPLKLQSIEKQQQQQQQQTHQSTNQEEEKVVDPQSLSFTWRDSFRLNLVDHDLLFSVNGNTPRLIQDVQTSKSHSINNTIYL